ncbi:TIGR04222 domain-containing membrane protein, partial [Xanthomonas campestris pv. campestris]
EPAPPSVRRLPRAVIGWALAAAVAAWLAYSANGGIPQPLQWRGVHFLPFFVTLIALGWSTSAWLRRALRGGRARVVDAVDASEFAYLSGGADRVADLLFTELLVRNAVYLDRDEDAQARRWVRWQPRIAVPPALEPALQALRSAEDPTVAWQALRGLAGPVRQQLIDKGLWLAPGAARWVRAVSTVPVAVVWVLGACKLVIGVQGGSPVGYLLGCMVLTSVLVLGFLLVPVRRTLSGDARLQARRQAVRRDAARTGADPGEAVALYGTVALVGTPWASYHEIRAPNTHHHDSTGSSCGGGGDGGDGGGGDSGGDGGGGCGGCGGGGD